MGLALNRDQQSILDDARWEHDRAREFEQELVASKKLDRAYVAALGREIAEAQALVAQGASAGHDEGRASARRGDIAAHLAQVLQDVRDDVKIATLDKAAQKAALVGAAIDAGRPELLIAQAEGVSRDLADHVLDPKAAHIDAAHLHDLATLAASLRDALAQGGKLRADRHDVTADLEHRLHLLQAQAAHVRLVARRVFRNDPKKLARFASPVHHHQIKSRPKQPA